ncbi:MAG: HlyD family efflux transporter periplasmic adaptor subunit [Lachnospiraceae bacterium]|nr:HlyD family efflux transporter periplasmic adaptor subunit [Lachnospiraceae bacterium]
MKYDKLAGAPKKKNKKKIILIIVILVILLAAGGCALWFFFGKNAGKNAKRQGFGSGAFGNFGSGSSLNVNLQGKVTASGVTNVGTVSETFDVTELETELRIEQVYVASGDELKAGDKILKLTEESVENARKELQEKERDAELSYRTGAIEYERSKIAAEYDRDSTKLSGTQADGVYQDSLLDMAQDVETAQSKLDEAKAQIQEYATLADPDACRAYYKVDEYQRIYDENLKILTDNVEKWGIYWSQVTGAGGGASMGGSGGSAGSMSGAGAMSGSGGAAGGMSGSFGGADAMGGSMGSAGSGSMGSGSVNIGNSSLITVTASDEKGQWVTILKNLFSVLEQNLSDLENAKEQYEEALATASLEKKLLELSLPELEENLAQAKASYEKAILQNQLTKEKSISNADRADHDYETALEKAESDFEALKSAWEDAKKNLEIFEEQVGDGYFRASADGSVLRNSVRANGVLRASATILTYGDLTAMTVTVSVDQSDVAKIKPGDAALVASQKGAMLDGVVKSVNPVSNSESRNNVTYSVTVEVDGAGALGSNESVTVVFGMTTADVSTGNNGNAADGTGEGNSNGERPGRGDGERPSWGDGEMPNFGDGQMPNWGDGEMPNFGDGEMPNFGDGQMPNWGDGEMPNFGDGQMPNFGDGQMPNFGDGERPERPSGRKGKDDDE